MGNPLSGVIGDVWLTATPSVSTTNESCTDSGDHITYTSSVHVFWDWNSTFTVQNSPNGSTGWTTITDYTVQWSAGRIVFNTARVPGTNAFTRISVGSYFTSTQLDSTHKWALTLKGNVAKTTSFQTAGAWETNLATIRGGTVKLDTYRNDNRAFKELNNLLGVSLYVDKTNNIRWQCYALVTDDSPAADAQNLEMETMTLTISRDVYYLTT